jgi:hypothetical protein
MKYLKCSLIALLLLISPLLPAQTPEQLKSWLPAIEGWTIADEIEIFDSDNLFNRINGAAPLFIENNFREMTSMEYKKGNEYITIQAYRHASPEDAFGMYSSERSSDLEFLSVGGEAQGGSKQFYFFSGSIYVKMQTNSSEEVGQELFRIAKYLADKIDPEADYPPLVKLFPHKGKIPNTEAYITSSYMGHDFLKSVYVVKYTNGGQEFQLFLIDAKSKEKSKEILSDYFSFTKQDIRLQEGEFIVQDKYNGDLPIVWKGQYIIGVFNDNGDQIKESSYRISELSDKL